MPASSSPLKMKATCSSSAVGPSSAAAKKLAVGRKEKPVAPVVADKCSHCEVGDKSCHQFLWDGVNCVDDESPIPGQLIMHIRV